MGQMVNKPVQTLFTEFVELRHAGYAPDEAWQFVQQKAKPLPKPDRQQLAMLAQQWETSQRSSHLEDDETLDTFETLTRPAANYAAGANQVGENAGEAAGADLTTGFEPRHYFGPDTVLLLYAKGIDRPLPVRLAVGEEAIVGRLAPNTILVPDIDLEPFGGLAAGVSRVHATFKHQTNALLISDLNSRNGTYINGQRLHEKELRLLQDGDELRFAQLVLIARFLHPVG
jgi:hypothetical protein